MTRQVLRAIDLNLRDVYVTPLRRRCVLRPGRTDASNSDHFTFAYLNLPGGFALTAANVRLLRKEGP